MNPFISFALSTVLSSTLILTSCASSPEAKAGSSPVPSATAISLDQTQKAEFPLNADEKKKLTKEFKKALAEEDKAFDHQEKSASKEFAAAQNSKSKAWRELEKKARHEYFQATLKGADRRQYVQTYMERKKQFDSSLKDETAANKTSWKQKHDLLRQSLKDREVQFQASLVKNERPLRSLWPEGH